MREIPPSYRRLGRDYVGVWAICLSKVRCGGPTPPPSPGGLGVLLFPGIWKRIDRATFRGLGPSLGTYTDEKYSKKL